MSLSTNRELEEVENRLSEIQLKTYHYPPEGKEDILLNVIDQLSRVSMFMSKELMYGENLGASSPYSYYNEKISSAERFLKMYFDKRDRDS